MTLTIIVCVARRGEISGNSRASNCAHGWLVKGAKDKQNHFKQGSLMLITLMCMMQDSVRSTRSHA